MSAPFDSMSDCRNKRRPDSKRKEKRAQGCVIMGLKIPNLPVLTLGDLAHGLAGDNGVANGRHFEV